VSRGLLISTQYSGLHKYARCENFVVFLTKALSKLLKVTLDFAEAKEEENNLVKKIELSIISDSDPQHWFEQKSSFIMVNLLKVIRLKCVFVAECVDISRRER
jgi:hypothetical protein